MPESIQLPFEDSLQAQRDASELEDLAGLEGTDYMKSLAKKLEPATDDSVVKAGEALVRSDPYNAEHIAALEASVAEQVAKQLYSFESNIALLKLYQFYPDQMKEDIVVKVLSKVSTRKVNHSG